MINKKDLKYQESLNLILYLIGKYNLKISGVAGLTEFFVLLKN